MTNYWHARKATVETCAKADPRQHQLEDREIDVAKEHNKASEEQEKGNVEKCWQYFDRPWKETLLDAFGKERTDSRPFVWTVM